MHHPGGCVFLGGRTGMISSATASMALLMTGLVKEPGLAYLLAASSEQITDITRVDPGS